MAAGGSCSIHRLTAVRIIDGVVTIHLWYGNVMGDRGSEGLRDFADLRRLADWFAADAAGVIAPTRLVHALGATAVPLLGRELRADSARRREAARTALATLATSTTLRARVIDELRVVVANTALDEAKVCALGLMAELGERGEARFVDPGAMQLRSALALAHHLSTPAEVAAAADLMIRQLDEDDLVQMIAVMATATPAAARALASELWVRSDLDAALRARIAEAAEAARGDDEVAAAERRMPTQVAVLVDAAARLVVVASRKIPRERRWRRWAVLIGASGHIEDCLHEAEAHDGDAAPLIANLVADGYRVASSELDHARDVVAAAARRQPLALGSAYYVGRDLLELGDAHLSRYRRPALDSLGRAVELIAAGELARAQLLLERCDPARADVAAAIAACTIASEPAVAAAHLARAIAAEPEWPLHHWNLAAALHQLGDGAGCCEALRRFVTTSAAPSGLYGDEEQPARVARAERMIATLGRERRNDRKRKRQRKR